MSPATTSPRALLAIGAGALLVRVAFVLWAPDGLVSDADFYHGYARTLARGGGYVNADGSPAVLWMPGWPAFLAALYWVAGPSVAAAKLANALLGALTAVATYALGTRLFDGRVGVVAGVTYAVWPGAVYYTAVLFSETLFACLLYAGVLSLAVSFTAQRVSAWLALGTAALAGAAWVRSELFALLPVLLITLVWIAPVRRVGLLRAAAVGAAVVLLIAPWTLRNAAAFGRFIPTAANGGTVFYEGNHAGAPGGNDLPFMLRFRAEFSSASLGESDVARGTAGWNRGWAFVRANPGEALGIAGRKLGKTYASDDRAPVLIRGFEGPIRILESNHVPLRGYIPESYMHALQNVANVYWYALLAAALLGLTTLRAWRPDAKWLVVGLLASFVGVHALMIGGARFHFAEGPLLALLAALGGLRLVRSRSDVLSEPA